MPNWLGDAVMGTPVLEDIRYHFPDAHLTVLCHQGIKNLLESNPFIDEFITFSREKKGDAEEKKKVFDSLSRDHFDIGILLTRSFSSAWWFWRGKVKRRIGFGDHCRRLLLTDSLKIPPNEEKEHLVITYKRLLAPLGIGISNTKPRLYSSEKEQQEARSLLQSFGIEPHHLLIGINPGAAFGSAKCWLPERFQELTSRLLELPDARVVYFGDNIGKPLVDEICKPFSEKVVNVAGKTSLGTFTALLTKVSCLVTNDSGPMHVAAALNTPLVAIFGSTNEIKTGPYDTGLVIHKHVACSPCYRRTCPIDFRCMKSITVDDVWSAIQRLVPNARK